MSMKKTTVFKKPIDPNDIVVIEISKWVDKNGDRIWLPIIKYLETPK